MTFPFSLTPRGLPLMGTAPDTVIPGYATGYNAQSNALDTGLDELKAEIQDDQYSPTIAALPLVDNWPGRLMLVGENSLWYGWDGTGWRVVTGNLPYFSGARSSAALGDTSGGNQAWLTATTLTRGISLSSGVLTFAVEGVYHLTQSVDWQTLNTTGQRNLGATTTGTLLGPLRSTKRAPDIASMSQEHNTHIRLASGDTVTPYVAHNAGVTLTIEGTLSVIWVASL